MKKLLGGLLALMLLFSCVTTVSPPAIAATKATETRAIAIVFDNSGSMYDENSQRIVRWSQATYAMEVFASMLNNGDALSIYPMQDITVDGVEYTMNSPLVISSSSESEKIRRIYTPNPVYTPIESVDCAIEGLKNTTADKKYLIILTDGTEFHQNNKSLKEKTVSELDKRIKANAGKGMTVMYLGITAKGKVALPTVSEADYPDGSYVEREIKNGTEIPTTLADMCNKIFGRDTLPAEYISESDDKISFDMSLKKLIVFVQGENITNLKLTNENGQPTGTLIEQKSVKYPVNGCGKYENPISDTTLQGMMVTYTDCLAGTSTLSYTGEKSGDILVYYEPDADLDFVFTDSDGDEVDPNALYEGDYSISFGMKDAKTGKLIESNLLGKPHYEGSYTINGEKTVITEDGYSGLEKVALKMNDSFDANLTVTYLSGYVISKDSSEFGWPAGGIKVAPRPAGKLKIEITDGESVYSLQDLEKGKAYTARAYYNGDQLKGEELKKVALNWDEQTSNAKLEAEYADDHIKLSLRYKDPKDPASTVCGKCTVNISASYCAEGSTQTTAKASLKYNIKDDFVPLNIELYTPNDYITIADLDESKPVTVYLTLRGEKLTDEEFKAASLTVDCGGINFEKTEDRQNSAYIIKLLSTDGIKEGDYKINASVVFTDHIGRTVTTNDEMTVTLSTIPLWVRWAIRLLLLLLIILIILLIMHIKVLPKKAHVTKRDSRMFFNSTDVTATTGFDAKIEKGQLRTFSKFGGIKSGIIMSVKPGKESYLKKPQVKRSAEVNPASVKKFGAAKITEATIGSIKYVLDPSTGKFERTPPSDKPFELKHNTSISYSGTMQSGGVQKPFTVTTKLNFKKK